LAACAIGEWPENQILISDWIVLTTLANNLGKLTLDKQKIKITRTNQQSNLRGACQPIFSLLWHPSGS